MPEYSYRAITDDGKIRTGKAHASNSMELDHRLNQMRLGLVACKEITPSKFSFRRKKILRKELINIVFQLEQLSQAGVPLLEGLHDIRDTSESQHVRQVLSGIIEGIQGGGKFSESLAKYPNDFDSVFISLMEVGEETGELPEILHRVGETLKWTDELISKAKKIMIYPAIVAFVVFGVTFFLMVYLVPQIVPFVKEMGGEVPRHTDILITTSNVFVEYWWIILCVPVAVTVTVKQMLKRSKNFRRKFDAFKLKIPIFGELAFKIRLARFANYLALLYASGITLMRALQISEVLVDNVVLSEAIKDVGGKISEGKSISIAFDEMEIFPALVVRMLKIGENTGGLDTALLNVSYFYNREIQETIDKIEPAITPILTVTMGTVLGWIMIAVLGPVWDTVSKI